MVRVIMSRLVHSGAYLPCFSVLFCGVHPETPQAHVRMAHRMSLHAMIRRVLQDMFNQCHVSNARANRLVNSRILQW